MEVWEQSSPPRPLYPSYRYHPTKSRRIVLSDAEAVELWTADNLWRDRHYTKSERTAMGLPERVRPERPRRNDFNSVEEWQNALCCFEADLDEYEQAKFED